MRLRLRLGLGCWMLVEVEFKDEAKVEFKDEVGVPDDGCRMMGAG